MYFQVSFNNFIKIHCLRFEVDMAHFIKTFSQIIVIKKIPLEASGYFDSVKYRYSAIPF